MNEKSYSNVPADFPRPSHRGAVAGVHDKLLMKTYNGQLYPAGETPPEVFTRWDACEHLAMQLADKSTESKAGKRAHMSETEILAQYLPRIVATIRWASEEEARWVIRRVASILDWPVPVEAQEEKSY